MNTDEHECARYSNQAGEHRSGVKKTQDLNRQRHLKAKLANAKPHPLAR